MTQPRLRVAFVLPALSAGGAERVLITLMNGLDRIRFDPHLIVIDPAGELRDLIAPDIPVHALGCAHTSPKALPLLLSQLRTLQPHIAMSTMLRTNALTLLCKPFLRKTVFIAREAVVPSYFLSSAKSAWVFKIIYRLLYPWADLVISPAQKIIDEFRTVIGLSTRNHLLLPNPVDVDKIRNFPLPERSAGRVHFICAGRLHAQKGFDRLIEALPSLPSGFDWTLTILGQGPEEGRLRDLIATTGLKDRVSMPGLSATPWPQMAAADVFLLPSRWEGLPNVALESLAAGTPVISMREAGGIDEIARQAPPGAVSVTDTMQAFIATMAKVRPAEPARLPRPSLLPQAFALDVVRDRFSALLLEQALRVRRTLP